jgi:hypothetical protein
VRNNVKSPKWIEQGPPVTDSLVTLTEQSLGFILPDGLIWFLKNVTNGGHPTPPPDFPILGLEGDDKMVLHGMYGISTSPDFDLRLGLSTPGVSRLIPRLCPIGFDPLGGQLFIVFNGEDSGQIMY